MKPRPIPPPTETAESIQLFSWCLWQATVEGKNDYGLIYHIPNEGLRSKRSGVRAKAMGLRPGFPDYCLPVARPPYSALYIELKRRSRGRVQPTQDEWIGRLRQSGARAEVCRGWEEAAKVIRHYVEGTPIEEPL